MKSLRERSLGLFVLAGVLLATGIGLSPEIAISRVDLNDNVFHYTLIEGMVNAVERGANPVDFWAGEWSFGYPVLRTYQPLGHGLVALTYFALGKSVGLMTVFVWVRFLSVWLLPLTFFATARLLSWGWLEAAAAALLAPLVSSNFLYGLEYGSYLWAGSGLFTQAVATHFLLLAIGFAYQGVRQGRRLGLAGIFLGLTFLSHFIYGYIGALTVCLVALMPDQAAGRGERIRRTVWMGAIAFLLAAFELVPMLRDGGLINHSRWEAAWKWDSFGAGQVLKLLFTGELLDHGRLPVLSLLALLGMAAAWLDYRRRGRFREAWSFVVYGAALWLLMFFGRPFWGPLLKVLGVAADMQLHRVIGGLQIFLLLLAAAGLAALWRESAVRWHWAATVAATAVLLYPMVRERAQFLSNNDVWGHRNLEAYAVRQSALEATVAKLEERGGRVYPGLAANWGGNFKVGDVPFYAFLSEARVPAVAFLYHSMALTGDIMVRFDEMDAAQYRLFNIRTVVAPAGIPVAAFLAPLGENGPFRLFGAPGGNYYDVVDAPFAVRTTRDNFYDINDRWLHSDWLPKGQYLRLDFSAGGKQMPRIGPEDALPVRPLVQPAGIVSSERRDGESFAADVQAARASFALFRMTWHPKWKAYVDGQPQQTVMLSPGFVGIPLMPGRHQVVCRYEPGSEKAVLALAGLLLTLLMCRMGLRPGLLRWPKVAISHRAAVAASLVALALPVAVSVATSRLPDGHDALEYFPRLEEFHQSIAHGILFPRWAPDLSRGTGQPFFEFNPPVIYYLAEAWHLAGFDLVTSMNLACAVLVIAAAAAMFLLARLYFGDWGGWLATAAYLYAPYFSVNLYVRSAMAEFAAFPFFALSLYGFGGFAKTGKRGYLLVGAAAYAGVLLSHNAASLLFTPLLVGFVVFTAWSARSWRVLLHEAYAFLLGLGLGACVWLPSLIERQYVGLHRLLEGYLRYNNHFVYVHQLLYSPWGYGISVAGDKDGMSFALGWSHLLLVMAAWIWMVRTSRHAERPWMRFFIGAAVVLSILMLEDAIWFWDQVPLLEYVEFPWRLLGPVSLCVALLVAPLGPLLASLPRWRGASMAGALALLIVPNLAHNQPKGYRDIDLAQWTPLQLATRGVEVTTAYEYVPRWVELWPMYDPRPVRLTEGEAMFQQSQRTPVSWSGRLQSRTGGTAEMPIAWFPGWEVRVDGQPVRAQPAKPTGLLRFQVPPGDHAIEAEWTRTSARWIGDELSLLSLVILIVAAGRRRRVVKAGGEREIRK